MDGLVHVEFQWASDISRLTPGVREHCVVCLEPPGGLHNRPAPGATDSAGTLRRLHLRLRGLSHLSRLLPSYRRAAQQPKAKASALW